jgi:hypothetical protein
VKRTMGDTWWTELRWRVSMQIILWGINLAPQGDAKGALIDAALAWSEECSRQRKLRYGHSN